ncbi:hypothetical protein [Leisingera aquaemixtae]|uniref:hypothetical protein n=1 Tax=Leisingera aquaemixtae TaxID=1396826 RepID=UPI0021A629EC|nr:hypothetical protein [Leisingera aquaemixtae]UWQ47200.1 hypothetical protein K3719_07505 [Leisingera aquaemixtae]
MDIEIEREVQKLTLDAIVLGRLLAEEWLQGSLTPNGSIRSTMLDTLRSLRRRQGLQQIDPDLIELMGEQIRNSLNEIREGKGDAATSQDVDLVWEHDQKVIEYVNLGYRWQQFKKAKVALDDKLAAIRDADSLLARVV